MRLWLSKNSEAPLREQITRQIMLAIVSGDLSAGQKLPSVREMALRYRVHSNTVSAAYQWLEENGWVASKRGSGVFVKEQTAQTIARASLDAESELDLLISDFFQTARKRGFSLKQIETRLGERLSRTRPEKIVIIEPDKGFARILKAELNAACDLPVVDFENASNEFWEKSVAVALSEQEARKVLPAQIPLIILKLNSVQDAMQGKMRPRPDELIAVVSGWERFLSWSRTMLIAARIEPEQIILRDTNDEDWQKGLDSCAFVIADSAAAKEFLEKTNVRVFRLISDASLAEIEMLVA